MHTISIVEKTKDYVMLKVPRHYIKWIGLTIPTLTEKRALRILKAGMREYAQGKTRPLKSLRDLRHGH